jgi:regulator of CtrA degradation
VFDLLDSSRGDAELIPFNERLTNSAAFGAMFREGMELIEHAAAYLDGPGRADAQALDRSVSLTYATESLRLTTRLMQLASWLLLHRAVKEGEMTLAEANRTNNRVNLDGPDPKPEEMLVKLPDQLRDLIARSISLRSKVRRMDASLHAETAGTEIAGNPLTGQIDRLKAAFER